MMAGNVCCLGWGRNNGRLGILRQLGSCNIDSLVSKESQAMFALLVEGLTHRTCVESTAKTAFGERCCFHFQRGEDDSHYISKYHFEIHPQNQKKTLKKQHKGAVKRDFFFWWNKLEMYRSIRQITWCDQLTSPRLQRSTRALFIQMEAPKGMDYKERSSAEAFDV